jgi:hypothetical protein
MNERLIKRAANLLGFMSEVEAHEVLVEGGVETSLAFLAVKAGKLYIES